MAIYCDRCRYQNRDSAKYCKNCSAELLATEADGSLQSGVILDRRYEIKRLIKSGGMGAVYEATDLRFKRPCAVKEMLNIASSSEEQEYFVKRFETEGALLYDLRHSGMPDVKDYFIEAGRYYLVMEYISGKDLETVMTAYGCGGVPEGLLIEWSLQILDVLDYLHSQTPPVVYRDLKPSNVMLCDTDNRIALVDFGIARSVARDGSSTMTGIGTPLYAPKEILLGKPEPRSDLYSLGATMHTLLTGLVPALPCDFRPVREHNPHISGELETIVMKALEQNPCDRFLNAKDMKRELEKLDKGGRQALAFTVPVSVNKKISDPVIKDGPEPDQKLSSESPSGVICAKCKMTLSSGATFCRKCGHKTVGDPQPPNLETRVKCNNCQKITPPGKFCGHCGNSMVKESGSVSSAPESNSEIICSKCGIKLSPGARFCRKCGKNVSELLSSSKEPDRFCLKCRKASPPGELCKNCGNPFVDSGPLKEVKSNACPACHTQLSPGARFCRKCRYQISGNVKTEGSG